jgi:hypothetical protein
MPRDIGFKGAILAEPIKFYMPKVFNIFLAFCTRLHCANPLCQDSCHVGKTLKQVEEPDDIESILVDRATLPKGDDEDGGIETRQVVDIEIIRHVTEYQAQGLMNKKTGERYVAPFPEGVTKAVQ